MRNLKKVVIIQAGTRIYKGRVKKYMFTNITCSSIAAAIPDDIAIEIIDMYVQDIDYKSIDADLALISTLTAFAPAAFEVAGELKKMGITTIAGGVHVFARPDECLEHFDAIALGEAEILLPEILNDFRNENLKRRYENREHYDLTKCGIPRYDLLKLDRYMYSTVLASKGCAFDCDFCSSRMVNGVGFRHKTAQQVINEIKYLQQLHEKNPMVPDALFFADSNLYTDRRFLIELVNALIPLKLRQWGFFASVDIAKDDEVLELLQKANCSMIQFGIESVNTASLKNANKKQNDPGKYKELVQKLATKGIYAHGSFIFGFDEDENSVFKETVSAIEDADFIMTYFYTLTPYPATRVFQRLYDEGRILHYDWSKYNMADVVFEPKLISEEELKNGLKYAGAKATDPVRLVKCLEEFNRLSGKRPRLKSSERIAILFAYLFIFFKLKPETRYFMRKLIFKASLVDYSHATFLIYRIQNP